MSWKRSIEEGVAVWRDGARQIAADHRGMMVIMGPRFGRFVRSSKRLLDVFAMCASEDDEAAVAAAWAHHLELAAADSERQPLTERDDSPVYPLRPFRTGDAR